MAGFAALGPSYCANCLCHLRLGRPPSQVRVDSSRAGYLFLPLAAIPNARLLRSRRQTPNSFLIIMPALRTRDAKSANALELDLTPTPPALSISIISPTPRSAAFSFPPTHNLADSPYASPSTSPFEPDLRGLDFAGAEGEDLPSFPPPSPPPALLPLSAYTRTLTPLPVAIPSTSTTAAPAPRRRRNPPLDPNVRRPKKGDDDYVKRPENAFILFRRQCCSAPSSSADGPTSAVVSTGKRARQADLSKTISAQWRALPPDERAKWEALAAEKKREHAEKHPNYVYRPQRKGSATTAAAGASFTPIDSVPRKASDLPMPIPPPVEFVIPAPRPRSQSHNPTTTTRTPAPYQSIQIPDVYSSSPASGFSFPASSSFTFAETDGVPPVSPDDMSLLPMIAQSSSMRTGGQSGSFDYVPRFGNALEFEASLQSSDFLRAMFPTSSNPAAMSMPPLTLSSGTPSSSESGSSPSSPYTPALSLVNAPFSTLPTPTPGAILEAAYAEPTPLSLDAADPWSAYGMTVGTAPGAPMDFDFDLASIPGAAVGGAWGGNGAVVGGQPAKDFDAAGFAMDFGSSNEGWNAGMEGWNGQEMNWEAPPAGNVEGC
ncbi:Repressor ROX1 [Mycena kentingensis (nom. inval.)]|nr:Repressor ROX1 [Mycena kentingensis (nom. inval.)]